MKYILILLILFSSKCYAQDNTIVLNLQLKAKTIKALAIPARSFTPGNFFNAYIKWYTHFKANLPNDNANVSIDTIPTTMIAALYNMALFDVKYQPIVADLVTSLTSKRNTNSLLDSLCTASEAKLTALQLQPITDGNKILTGTAN